jgi:glycerol-3-phosphate dehydrogenase
VGWRADALERLEATTFDLMVVGGGVIGSRIAYEASRAGARVALVDAGDFAGATSSASSKLVHGGLRYLPMGDVALVREAQRERQVLMTRVAPHLIHRLPFVIPIYADGPHRALSIGAGVLLYSALSGFRGGAGRLISPARARAWVPAVRMEGMRSAALYEDGQTDDGRLVLATVLAAEAAGAVVLNHARVTGFEESGDRLGAAAVDTEAGQVGVRARSFINAAGPWVDQVRRMEDPAAEPSMRLSKGVHVTMPLEEGWQAALAVPLERLRVAFAVPWEGMLLLGTTDTEYSGDPGSVSVEAQDLDQLLAEASIGLQPEVVDRKRILASFAGVRVLPGGEGDTALARRGHLVSVGRRGMVSVAGGKLTTHRRIALDVLSRLPQLNAGLSGDPLPGAGRVPSRPEEVGVEEWAHLVHVYGSLAADVAAYRRKRPDALSRIHPGGPDLWAQVDWAVDHEWATTVEDVVRRRTSLELRGLAGAEVREQVSVRMQPSAA